MRPKKAPSRALHNSIPTTLLRVADTKKNYLVWYQKSSMQVALKNITSKPPVYSSIAPRNGNL